MVTSEPNLESLENLDVAWCEIWGMWLMGDAWNFVILSKTAAPQGRCDRVHCHGAESNYFNFSQIFCNILVQSNVLTSSFCVVGWSQCC
jgi:hypothetical protein